MSKKCRCPLWATGTLESKPYRRSLKTRSFERAEQLKREIENGNKPEQTKIITIEYALKAFTKDCESRNLCISTLRKYESLQANLLAFAGRRHLSGIGQLDAQLIREYRDGRSINARTSSKELERIRAFFSFAVESGWLSKNPAKAIKAPKLRDTPTLPLSDVEVQKIMAHADFRTQVFFRLLLHSGLRIIDAAQLTPQKINDGKVFLYTQKTGTPVLCPLPPDFLADLQKLPLVGGFYFAVQSVAPVSIAERYRQKLNQAAIKAGLGKKKVKGTPREKNIIHPHRFRDTAAVRWLQAGIPIEEVATLLGHSSIRVTEKHYSPWVKARQTRLEELVRATWKPALVRVK
jgi:integrase